MDKVLWNIEFAVEIPGKVPNEVPDACACEMPS